MERQAMILYMHAPESPTIKILIKYIADTSNYKVLLKSNATSRK